MVVIEHHLDVIKNADILLTLDRGRGTGGYVVATGTPEEMAQEKSSATGQYLGGVFWKRYGVCLDRLVFRHKGGKVTREEALDSIKANVENENLIKHMLATEAIMRALARRSVRMRRSGGLPGSCMI